MSDPIKVFSKVYVGLREQHHREGEEAPPYLGFLTPYEENAAGRKRIETVTNWARPHDQYRYDHVEKKQILVKKAEVIPAKILDNEPLEGYEICREVKRTGWNGGNVVWRILDPRGFELEISSANMAKILTFATIEAGTIKGKCIWGRLGSNNLLMPEGCPEYANIIPKAEEFSIAKTLKGKLIPNSEIKIGDYVQLHNRSEGFYLGKWNMLLDQGSEFIGGKVAIRHVIYSNSDYYVISELKVLSKPKPKATAGKPEFLTVSELEQHLNKVKRFNSFGTSSDITPRLICSGKIDLDKVKLVEKVYDKETFLNFLRTKAEDKFSYLSDFFKIKDFQKIEAKYDYRYLTLVAKHKDGKFFKVSDIEISRQSNSLFPQQNGDDYQPKIDAWLLNRKPAAATNGFVRHEPSNASLRGRRRDNCNYSYYRGGDYFSYCFDGHKDVKHAKQAVINFFQDDVEEVYFYMLELETPDGVTISNTLYLT